MYVASPECSIWGTPESTKWILTQASRLHPLRANSPKRALRSELEPCVDAGLPVASSSPLEHLDCSRLDRIIVLHRAAVPDADLQLWVLSMVEDLSPQTGARLS